MTKTRAPVAGPERYLEPEIETMPRAELEALQAERVLELVPYAYEHAGLYREVWDAAGVHPRDIRSLEDFTARVPFITKDTIREYRDRHNDPYGGLLCVPPSELTAVGSSSGTTGDATLFAERWGQSPPLPTSYARDLWELGLRPGDRIIGGALMLRGVHDEAARVLHAVPVAVNTWAGHWEEVIEAIRGHRPAYCQLLGSIVVELDHLSDRYDLAEVFSSFKFASYGGEPLGARMKEKIRDEWALDVFSWTSAGDTGVSWECWEADGCHLWEDTAFFEHLDPAGTEPVPDMAVGELVATSLDNPVAPLVRFRSDDLVRLTRAPCGCGRTHGRQWPLGRRGDEVVVDGTIVMPLQVWPVIEAIPETATGLFQIVRPVREVDRLQLRVGYNQGRTTDVAALRDRIGAAVEAELGVTPEVQLLPEAELIARGSGAKIPRVVRS